MRSPDLMNYWISGFEESASFPPYLGIDSPHDEPLGEQSPQWRLVVCVAMTGETERSLMVLRVDTTP